MVPISTTCDTNERIFKRYTIYIKKGPRIAYSPCFVDLLLVSPQYRNSIPSDFKPLPYIILNIFSIVVYNLLICTKDSFIAGLPLHDESNTIETSNNVEIKTSVNPSRIENFFNCIRLKVEVNIANVLQSDEYNSTDSNFIEKPPFAQFPNNLYDFSFEKFIVNIAH
ncbi:hypothetical protein HZS_4039 [Henneguya salminicola]|nr:hypothetical protein HZS_4039 [Henneguya salminicola]